MRHTKALCQLFIAICMATLATLNEAKPQSCSASMTNLNWGSVNVLPGAAISTSATLSLTCTLGLSLQTVRFCVSMAAPVGASCRQMSSGSNALYFDLFSDAAHSQEIGSATGGACSGAGAYGGTIWQVDVPLNVLGSGSASYSVYGAISAGQSTAVAASYAASYATAGAWAKYNYALVGGCAGILSVFNGQVGFTTNLSATVAPNCSISAGMLDFGQTSTHIIGNIDASTTLNAQCANGSPYSIGFGAGGNASGAQRRVRLGATSNYINYGLYSDAGRSNALSTTASSTSCTGGAGSCILGTGTGATQSIPIYGRAPPQTAGAQGVYTDSVVVTITY